jgi:hypothetical protein
MTSLSTQAMQGFLRRSISSFNDNKLNGLLAEIDFRTHLAALGFASQVSAGGWIARSTGTGSFGHDTVVLFPETIVPGANYAPLRPKPMPASGLHTICATFHQIGIRSFFCSPSINSAEDCASVSWEAQQLGIPSSPGYGPISKIFSGFQSRSKRYNFLRYQTNVSTIPASQVPEEFSKEHLRIAMSALVLAEISDVDGVFWGNRYTYPLEIKEKTVANDARLGPYFGLDLGPFVKLAFYAARRGNLHSLFVVREIADTTSRALVEWHFITFEQLAQFASWIPSGGGANMLGGTSTVVRIPKSEFQILNSANLGAL